MVGLQSGWKFIAIVYLDIPCNTGGRISMVTRTHLLLHDNPDSGGRAAVPVGREIVRRGVREDWRKYERT